LPIGQVEGSHHSPVDSSHEEVEAVRLGVDHAAMTG
jgi:hypothetical protein